VVDGSGKMMSCAANGTANLGVALDGSNWRSSLLAWETFWLVGPGQARRPQGFRGFLFRLNASLKESLTSVAIGLESD
jgi:hypothetical protein